MLFVSDIFAVLKTPGALPRGRFAQLAFVACLLLPWLLVFSRTGAELCLAVCGLGFLTHAFTTRDTAALRDPFLQIGLIAWGWMVLVASPLAVSPMSSLGMGAAWVRWLLLYASLRFWLLRDSRAITAAAANIAILMAIVWIDTAWQYVTGVSISGHVPNESYRLTGPLDNVKVGVFMAKLSLPSAFILLVAARRKGGRGLWPMVYLAACFVMVALSGERTATFSFLLALGVMVLPVLWLDKARRTHYLLGIVITLAAAFAIVATQPTIQHRLSNLTYILSTFGQSVYGQLVWTAWQIGLDNPFTGAGLKGFRELCVPFLDSGQVSHCNLHPHNPYAEWLSELGFTGLFLLCGLAAALLRHGVLAVRAGRGVLLAPGLCFCGLTFMHFFPLMATQSQFSNWPAMLLWYSVAIGASALNMVYLSSENSVSKRRS